nr:MoaD/ThiS family protein [uncultured Carboxylicivirga sp.]
MERKQIYIQFFGGLKDYFDKTLTLELPSGSLISDCLQQLMIMQPAAIGLLNKCAIAINGTINKENTVLSHNDHVVIMPPYSGG